MTLSIDQTVNTVQVRDWVAEAGEIAMHYFKHVDAEWKGIADPVTVADREIERLLSGYIRQAHPDHGIIGEEYGSADLDRDFLWAIDPIDGTRVYVEGLPTWCVTLGLLYRREPVFGLVYMPVYDDWTYTEGDDVICNGVSIRDRLRSDWDEGSYVFARSDAHAHFNIPFTRVMAYGSTAVHMAYTARGASVATLSHDAYLWDIAGGLAILNKQGGELCDLNGKLLDLRDRDLTQRIDGMYVAGHRWVARRLSSMVTPRKTPYHHGAW